MIDLEIARQARSLLSVTAAILLEDHHDELVTTPRAGDAAVHAERLRQLGADLGALGAALEVITRQGETNDGD